MDNNLKAKIVLAFLDLFKSSTIIQGTMALGVTTTIGYLYLNSRQVPDTLTSIVMLILGFYFGSKNQQRTNQEVIENVTRNITRSNARADTTD